MEAPIRVLIGDDTAHVRRMLRSMLELDGFEVVADVGAGAEVAKLVEDGVRADVIVLDERMPDLDGIETARRVRAVRPGQVVLLYTAFPHRRLEEQAAVVGVAAVLAKVDGLEALERAITRHSTTRL